MERLRMSEAPPAAGERPQARGADRQGDDHICYDATRTAPTGEGPTIFRHPLTE